MKKPILTSLAALLAGAGVALAEPPAVTTLPPVPATTGQAIVTPVPVPAPSYVYDGNSMPVGQPVIEDVDGSSGGRFWFDAEYLLWWTKAGHIPPLVTTSSPAVGGALGPNTTVLFGGDSDGEHPVRDGGRFSAGFWLDCDHTFGIEAGYFFLGSHANGSDFSRDTGTLSQGGNVLLARPFFNTATGTQDAEVTALPGAVPGLPPLATGNISIRQHLDLQGAEANAVCTLCCGCNGSVGLLAGGRWVELRERLDIAESVNVTPGVGTFGGDTIGVFDSFRTRNEFYGGQVGVEGEWRRGRFFLDAISTIAFGNTRETVDIRGLTRITTPAGVTTVSPAGLLALRTNSGHFSRDQFAVMPEEILRAGIQVTKCVRFSIGYDFLALSNVVRPGDQIDPALNPNLIPTSLTFGQPGGAARPAFAFHDTGFWAQGVNFGLEFRY